MQRRQVGTNPRAPYYPALHGLRAVAVVLVFLAHYDSLHIGWMGVNIFFVLSGFLITGILYDSRHREHRFRDFYARRTLRIFPLYYGIWLALLLSTPLLRFAWHPENALWPLYLGNWIPLLQVLHPAEHFSLHLLAHPVSAVHPLSLYVGHFWSLCIEEQFYFIWPLVVFSVSSRNVLLRVCLAAVVLCPILRMAAMHFLPLAFTANGVIHNFTFLRFDEFLLGGIGALGMRGPLRERLQKAGTPLFLLGVVCIAFSFGCARFALHRPTDIIISMRWILSCGITFVDIAALGMIFLCLNAHSWFSRIMNTAALRAIGRVSYGFYVFHDIPHAVYDFLNQRLRLQGTGLHLILPFCATLALSLLSYKFLERPFLGLKTRFEGGRKETSALAS